MENVDELAPIGARERIQAMDVLRGFALLGILLMNIEAMVGPMFAAVTGTDLTLEGADRWVDAAIHVLVQGKFFTLFSLLFGMGFAVMLERAALAGRPFAPLYVRRSVGLLVIGVLHALLVWSGDVLVTYALVSLPLLLFARAPVRHLPFWGVVIYLLPVAFTGGLALLMELARTNAELGAMLQKALDQQGAQVAATIAAERAAFGGGDYLAAVAQRARDSAQILMMLPVAGAHVLGMFVLGTWFVRSGAIRQPSAFPRLYRTLRWVAFPAGLALMLIAWMLEPQIPLDRLDLRMATATALAAIAGLLMCLGYVAWIIRGLESTAWRGLLSRLAPAGRMALTNYLLQSIVCTAIFYGYGLGYFEQLPRAWQPVFVLVLFGVQVAFSRAWLARHTHGPAERVWRAWTYGGRVKGGEVVRAS